MNTLRRKLTPLLLTLLLAVPCFGAEPKPAPPQKEVHPAVVAMNAQLDRIDTIHAPGYMNWISVGWATMLMEQGIISAEDAPAAADVVQQLWEFEFKKDERGWGQFYKDNQFFEKRLDKELAGMMMIVRTQPTARQMMEVRHHLMKQMTRIYDLQAATLDLAAQHTTTIMPGYTHFRHAQPTTFGHYLLSVSDAIGRSTKTLEHGYHLMSLNELGCGALAGTSWPIDRDLVSQYLGMEGLIENANDAVSYTDGYLVVVSGLANVTNIASRTALEMSYWSGVEYGFLDIGFHRGHSFMMPQKDGNPNSMEIIRMRAGQMAGHLTSVAVAGLRAPHGDVFEMLHIAEPTLAALEATKICTRELSRELRNLQVNTERMAEVISESYIASTELANQMARDHDMGYRTAHDIVNKFVLASRDQQIPASEAQVTLLEEVAQEVVGRRLGMTEARLRQLLDPVYFIEVTNSQGGVAPAEVGRMIAVRRQQLADARGRHLSRIETLEAAQKKLLSDLKRLHE
jgi:argininosuccinate lyase